MRLMGWGHTYTQGVFLRTWPSAVRVRGGERKIDIGSGGNVLARDGARRPLAARRTVVHSYLTYSYERKLRNEEFENPKF